MATLRPHADMAAETALFAEADGVPNNPRLPLVLLRGAFGPDVDPAEVAAAYAANGWTPPWRYHVFSFHHFHPNVFEALTVVAGSAEILFGGPSGRAVRVAVGDVAALPPGTGHCQVSAAPDFAVLGTYPVGHDDVKTIRPGEAPVTDAVRTRIAAVPVPTTDPVYGADGPTMQAWRRVT